MKKLLFICGGKDFHAMDKYSLIVKRIGVSNAILITDTIEGEDQKSLIKKEYILKKLFIIDRFIPKKQIKFGNILRNIVKLLLLPIQVLKLKIIFNEYKPVIVHAVPMYYMFLCYLARIPYIGTPQASEILIRPKKSKLYKYFTKKILKNCSSVIVDSAAMAEKIKNETGISSVLIKNGFNTRIALKKTKLKREKIVSIRGLQSNYQILDIISSRDKSKFKMPINFIFPFHESDYLKKVKNKINSRDKLIGKLNREDLYEYLSSAKLVISIPTSDSSPRSVYESIFCGAVVAISHQSFINELPECMLERVYVVDYKNKNWFEEAIIFANNASNTAYMPSIEALNMCDQGIFVERMVNSVYKI